MEVEKQKLLQLVDEPYESSATVVNDAQQMVKHVETMQKCVKDIVEYPACEVFDLLQTGTKRLTENVVCMMSSSAKGLNGTKELIFLRARGRESGGTW